MHVNEPVGRYEGKRIHVIRFGVFEFQTVSLYLSRDDAEFGVRANSVALLPEHGAF